MKSQSVLSIFLLLTSFVSAQTVAIKKVELVGEKVIVHYDLDDGNPNNEYLLSLYSSKDNFATALTKVSGDVGMEIKPGNGKKIEWNIIQEYGGYKGKLALEIKGKVYVPFVKLQGFDTKKTYARGKSHQIKWKPGSNSPINIELYKGGERITGEINHPNNGLYSLFIPKHAKNGKEYRLKISDPKSSEEVIYSDYFKVGPKIPLWAKVGAAVVVGGVAVILLQSGDKNPNGGDNTNTDNIETPTLPGG
jgi:hypothetical protein